jgi:hypothetical protein
MRQARCVFQIIVLSVLAAVVCVGQQRNSPESQNNNGKIQGVLLDINDARIVGARIIIESGQFKRQLRSGNEGDFEIQVPAGTYQIKVEANGFRKFELSPFKVKANVTEMINIHMEVAAPSGPLKASGRLTLARVAGKITPDVFVSLSCPESTTRKSVQAHAHLIGRARVSVWHSVNNRTDS